MTAQETGAVMDILRAAYPQFYRGLPAGEAKNVIGLWAAMFGEEPVAVVLAAVKRLIASDVKGFPPSIGAVKEQIYRLYHPQERTEQEAWSLVVRAVNTGDAERSFAQLPPDVQAVVGSPVRLTEWGRMDESAFLSVTASNFQRSYRAQQASRREQAKLPGDVRRFADRLGGGTQAMLEGDVE